MENTRINIYQNGKIYKLTSNQTSNIYIGSTTRPLKQRLSNHKNDFKMNRLDSTARELLKYKDVKIELIEEYPTTTQFLLEKREGEYIRASKNCVNKLIPGSKENVDKYLKGKIYKIVSNQTDKIYIGSTVNTLGRRFSTHKYKYNKHPENYTKYKDIFHYNDARIELIELYPTSCKYLLHCRERFYIESMTCINKNIPARSIKELNEINKKYRETRQNYLKRNHNIIKQKRKIYTENNKEKIKISRKIYYENNKNQCAQRTRKYYQSHKEQNRTYSRLHNIKNRDKNNERHRLYNNLNKEKIREQRKRVVINNKEKMAVKSKEKVKCNICDKEVNKVSIYSHKKIHDTQEEKNKQKIKNKIYRQKNKNIISRQRKIKVKCNLCDKEISKHYLSRHKKMHNNSQERLEKNKEKPVEKRIERVNCDECGKEMNKTSLREHKKTHNKKDEIKERVVCVECGKEMYKISLRAHKKIHLNKNKI